MVVTDKKTIPALRRITGEYSLKVLREFIASQPSQLELYVGLCDCFLDLQGGYEEGKPPIAAYRDSIIDTQYAAALEKVTREKIQRRKATLEKLSDGDATPLDLTPSPMPVTANTEPEPAVSQPTPEPSQE